jgi:asd_EA: aspartate-semialdehyde dehydrogenase
VEGIRAARGHREHVPGHFRRGQDVQGLAGNGGQHHSVHLRRGSEVREGAAEGLRPCGRGQGRDCAVRRSAAHHLAVHPRARAQRPHRHRVHQLR